MEVERYSSDHAPLLEGWLRARGREPGALGELPPTGYIAGGCAAGFLYKTDGGVAYLDSFVSDPHASKELRRDALRAVMHALVCEAKASGYGLVAGTTAVPSLLDAAKAAGLDVFGLGFAYVCRRF